MNKKNILRLVAPMLLLAGMLLTAVPGCNSATNPPAATGEDLKFTGVIQSKAATSWVIGGQTFKVDSYTRLDSGLNVGVTARVEYVVQSDGSKLAIKIETP